MSAVQPFRIAIPDADLTDLRERLHRTRWPERECVDDWSQGIPLDYTKELATYWVGQGVGLMNEAKSVRAVMQEFQEDFLAAYERLGGFLE